MTHDEARAMCIETIGSALARIGIFISYGQAVLAFDSLHGIARVNLPEATEEMLAAGGNPSFAGHHLHPGAASIWRAMSAAGDLTNPPEKKL